MSDWKFRLIIIICPPLYTGLVILASPSSSFSPSCALSSLFSSSFSLPFHGPSVAQSACQCLVPETRNAILDSISRVALVATLGLRGLGSDASACLRWCPRVSRVPDGLALAAGSVELSLFLIAADLLSPNLCAHTIEIHA